MNLEANMNTVALRDAKALVASRKDRPAAAGSGIDGSARTDSRKKSIAAKGYFHLSASGDGRFSFKLKAANHRALLNGESHASLLDALEAIEQVRAHSSDRRHFEHRFNSNGTAYFVLLASDGQVIGTSDTYTEISALAYGIRSVMRNGQTTFVKGLG